MYADYLKERTGDDLIQSEKGFATFRFIDEKTVYLVDLFVKKEFRNIGEANFLADQVCALAKQKGCNKLIGTVAPNTNGATANLKHLLGYGMSLVRSDTSLIVFEKEI